MSQTERRERKVKKEVKKMTEENDRRKERELKKEEEMKEKKEKVVNVADGQGQRNTRIVDQEEGRAKSRLALSHWLTRGCTGRFEGSN